MRGVRLFSGLFSAILLISGCGAGGSGDARSPSSSPSPVAMDATNKKGFRLMEQVKPRLIIQTHTSTAAVQYAATLWPVLGAGRPSVTVTAADLPAETSLLLLGGDAAFHAGQVPAEKVAW